MERYGSDYQSESVQPIKVIYVTTDQTKRLLLHELEDTFETGVLYIFLDKQTHLIKPCVLVSTFNDTFFKKKNFQRYYFWAVLAINFFSFWNIFWNMSRLPCRCHFLKPIIVPIPSLHKVDPLSRELYPLLFLIYAYLKKKIGCALCR